MIVGIDNGLKGGLCAVSKHDGSIIAKTPMPIYKRRGKWEVDPVTLYKWFRDLNPNQDAGVVLEEPLHHAPSSQAVRSMAISFGKIMGALETHGVNIYPVQVADWQKRMLEGRRWEEDTKAHALRVVQGIIPDEDWLAGDRCRNPHDGMVDAYLIARYAWLEKIFG